MAFYRFYTFVLLLFCSVWLVNPVKDVHRRTLGDHFLRGLEDKVTTNVSLWAPYYRDVSAGEAWMIPSSAVDLGARAMECQCFNPDETCCLTQSMDMAPFCIPRNSTCCSDTFCGPGETCCGDSCCPSETVCTFNQFTAGCCPKGQLCSGPAICYDHASPNCTNNFFALPQCCPESVPFCRDFSPIGIGCFVTSAEPTITTTMGKPFSAFSDTSKPTSHHSAAVTVITLTQTITLHPVEDDSSTRVIAQSSSPLINESFTSPSISINPGSTALDTNITTIMANSSTSTSISTTTIANPTTTTTTVSPTLCFNPDLQTPGPCSSPPRGSSTPGAAASTFNPSSLSPKLVSAVPACVGITVTFAISLLMSVAHCCMPRREKKDPDAVPGLPKTKLVPGEELEGKGDRK